MTGTHERHAPAASDLDRVVAEIVDRAPPLSDQQVDRLRGLLPRTTGTADG